MTDQNASYDREGKRLSHSYVDSYDSSNIEEKIDCVGDSRPELIDCFAQHSWWWAMKEWARRGDARVRSQLNENNKKMILRPTIMPYIFWW